MTDDNVTKRRDYEDEVVKVFYLKNPTTVQEFQEIVTAIRSVSDVRRMFTFNAQNAVMVRDTVDKVALVEKLLHDMDKPKAEVVMDLIVMEVNSDTVAHHRCWTGLGERHHWIVGAVWLYAAQSGDYYENRYMQHWDNYHDYDKRDGNQTRVSPTRQGLARRRHHIQLRCAGPVGHIGLNDFSTSLPGAMLQAVMSDTSTRVMQSPEIRVSDGQKVPLEDRRPNPVCQRQFPAWHRNGGRESAGEHAVPVRRHRRKPDHHAARPWKRRTDVGYHGRHLERQHNVTIGGLTQPVISQRKTDAHIRVRDGEVSLLGGLMQTPDSEHHHRNSRIGEHSDPRKIPLRNNAKDKSRSELLVAVIPHIVRTPDIDERICAESRWPGSKAEAQPWSEARGSSGGAAAAATADGSGDARRPTTTCRSFRAGRPAIFRASVGASAIDGRSCGGGCRRDNATDLAAVPVTVRWDPKILRLNQVAPARADGKDGAESDRPWISATIPAKPDRNQPNRRGLPAQRVRPLMQFTFTRGG